MIAPTAIKIEEGLEPSTSGADTGDAEGDATDSSAPTAAVFHPVVSVPNCAPIAALHTGSPVTLKPAYYIQISKMGVPQLQLTTPAPPATTATPPPII